MSEFMPPIVIHQEQAEVIAHGLFAVARADGEVHEREAALIREFFASTTGASSDLGALERAPKLEPSTLAQLLTAPDVRRLFIKTALLLALTDSELGPGESQTINDYARACEIPPAELALLQTQVKEYLLSQLSHLKNVDATIEVARELKM